ncbi:MAG: histidinol-phosphate transaminase [Betaproteobacteria bacterium]
MSTLRPVAEHSSLPGATGVDSDAVTARIAATVRADIRALAAYPVAKAEGLVKLDAMENPFGLPAQVRAEMAAAVANVAINRYPDGGADGVKSALRRSLGLSDDVGLILGNGSDELLQLLTTIVVRPGAVVLAPDPSFVMYRLYALYAGARFVGVPLRADFTLDVEAMLDTMAREQPALVWLAYPNNPTGNLFSAADVERIIRAASGVVAVDEAYYAYASDSFLPRVLDFPNLIVVRTVSKIGMAGVRLGYAVAHPAWIAELEKVRPPYNVNSLTQAVVPVLLEHESLLAGQAATLCTERERVGNALAALRRVTVFPTQANFVLIRVPDAPHWFATLRDAGILVKNVSSMHPLLAHCLRITIGTPAENDALLEALSRYL